MDGVHDLGGMHGFGPVLVEADEPVFAADWERRAFGLVGAAIAVAGPSFTRTRAAIERMDPAHYLSSPYYEHWVTAIAGVAVDAGVLDRAELEDRAGGPFPLPAPPPAGPPPAPAGVAVFTVGDRVSVRDVSHPGHTRCPRYVRRRRGTITRVHEPMAFPDREAASGEVILEAVYTVAFTAAELWGDGDAVVHVDLWASYLEPA